RALVRRLKEHGGDVRCGARVDRIVVREARAAAVHVEGEGDIEASRAIVADVAAPSLYLKLLDPGYVPTPVLEAMRPFPYRFGTFKMDWALSEAVPWSAADARDAAVVHAGDSVDDLAAFVGEVRAGSIPSRPYLVIGQQSLADPTRAPPGRHTLWAYS